MSAYHIKMTYRNGFAVISRRKTNDYGEVRLYESLSTAHDVALWCEQQLINLGRTEVVVKVVRAGVPVVRGRCDGQG